MKDTVVNLPLILFALCSLCLFCFHRLHWKILEKLTIQMLFQGNRTRVLGHAIDSRIVAKWLAAIQTQKRLTTTSKSLPLLLIRIQYRNAFSKPTFCHFTHSHEKQAVLYPKALHFKSRRWLCVFFLFLDFSHSNTFLIIFFSR